MKTPTLLFFLLIIFLIGCATGYIIGTIQTTQHCIEVLK